jgi:hypothetical protein
MKYLYLILCFHLICSIGNADTPPAKTNNALLYDAAGNALTSDLVSAKRGLDMYSINPITSPSLTSPVVGGALIDPRQIRSLGSGTDSVAATQSGTWTTGRTWSLLNTTDSVNVGNFPLGQKPMATSIPVSIASDQSILTVNNIPQDGAKSTYSAAAVFVAPLNATDIFVIKGSATKTIRVTKISISATQTTGAIQDIFVIKRLTASTGGTSTAQASSQYDSNSATSTAVASSFTANPTTLGTASGIIKSMKIVISSPNGGVNGIPFVTFANFEFGNGPSSAVVLRGIAQSLVVNFNGQSAAGNSFNIYAEWTEE